MNDRVLVVYASQYGATAEIAEKIGEALRQAGLNADVLSADSGCDPGSYGAVVLGSAVYIGRWRKEASRFLSANEKLLTGRPVWLFSTGPTGDGKAEELLQGWRFPGALKPVADRIQPRGITVFHGYLNNEKLNFIEKWMIKKVKAPAGDFRDWDAISRWARSIADALKIPEAPNET